MSYKDRLNKLSKAWETDKAVAGAGQLPAGKYQFQIKRAYLEESKASFNKGHLQAVFEVAVITGPAKNRKAWIRTDLEAPANPAKNFPSGMSRFKGYLETLKVEMPKVLSEKAIKGVLEQLIGIVFNGACVHNAKGYANIYINDLVNAPAEAEDEEEETGSEDTDEDESEQEEATEDADEDDDEDAEDEDEEEEEPVKKPAPTSGKKPAKVAASSKKDDDDWDSEFDKS